MSTLTPSEIEVLAADLVGAEPSHPFGIYVVSGNQKYAKLATIVENEVFFEHFGNTPQELEREYGPYAAASRYILAIDALRYRPIGVIRVIEHSKVGHKLFNDIQQDPWRADRQTVLQSSGLNEVSTWEVGTLALARNYRRQDISVLIRPALYHSLFVLSCRINVEHWIAIVDDSVLNQLLLPFGIPFKPLGGLTSKPYLGSPSSSPVVAHVPSVADGVRAAGDSFYELLVLGRGLTDDISFPDWDAVGNS